MGEDFNLVGLKIGKGKKEYSPHIFPSLSKSALEKKSHAMECMVFLESILVTDKTPRRTSHIVVRHSWYRGWCFKDPNDVIAQAYLCHRRFYYGLLPHHPYAIRFSLFFLVWFHYAFFHIHCRQKEEQMKNDVDITPNFTELYPQFIRWKRKVYGTMGRVNLTWKLGQQSLNNNGIKSRDRLQIFGTGNDIKKCYFSTSNTHEDEMKQKFRMFDCRYTGCQPSQNCIYCPSTIQTKPSRRISWMTRKWNKLFPETGNGCKILTQAKHQQSQSKDIKMKV